MKLLRFGPIGSEKPGILDAEGQLRDLSSIISDFTPQSLSTESLARLRELNLKELPRVEGSPRIGSCVTGMEKIIGVGLNYKKHAEESGMKLPEEPVLFMKPPVVQGPNDDLVIPKGSKETDYEVELAVVIGKIAKDVSEADALQYVAGYTIANDVSEREWQIKRGGGQWTKGKCAPVPLGPYLVTTDEIPDPQKLDLTCFVNGKERQNSNTMDMGFSVKRLVSEISKFMTLKPGDVILTGTPAGVGLGQKPVPIYLKQGDTVKLAISGLGEQQQHVVDQEKSSEKDKKESAAPLTFKADPETFLLCQCGHFTAEGPLWDPNRKVYFYADIESGTVCRFDPSTNETTRWQIGEKGQMVGGNVAINDDGSIILMLEGGTNVYGKKNKNSGVVYLNPDSPAASPDFFVVPNSLPTEEVSREYNRPNDSTVITIGGKNLMLFGSMSKNWKDDAKVLPDGSILKEGEYYLLDENLKSHRLIFEGNVFPGCVISNGLADGGANADGTHTIYWSECVCSDDINGKGKGKNWLNVYKGVLHPNTFKVSNVEIFADHQALTDGKRGRADGASMINVNGEPAYAVGVLQTGQVRAYDPKTHEEVARIELPLEAKDVTKYAIGENRLGKPAIFFTTQNFNGERGKSGSTFLMPLPPEISLHPASILIANYPPMKKIRERAK